MAVSDDRRVGPKSLPPEKLAQLQAQVWMWAEQQNMSSRSISRKLEVEHGVIASHTTVLTWLKETREANKVLDLLGPAEVRAGQLGRIENYLEHLWTAIQNQEVDTDVGFKLLHQYESLLTKVSGSAVPTRSQVEVTSTGNAAAPNMLLMQELARQSEEYTRATQEREASDGLGNF